MPGLLRGVARTAVIAGTATAVSNRVSRRQAGRWARHDEEAAVRNEEPPAPPEDAPAPSGTDDVLAQLRQLGELRDQGVLTDDEFTQQKQRILAQGDR